MIRKGLLAVLALGMIAPAAAQADPTPFGNACSVLADQGGVRFCQAASTDNTGAPINLDRRPTSFDGTPIDADVTLPPTGSGPWPTIIMVHGYGGNKKSYETTGAPTATGLNNVSYAARGYAVVTVSSRGFGLSCGHDERSRTTGCDNGYVHLMDTRYEAHDFQHLLGKLVDEGIADPANLGTLGASYGGGASLELAYLKDRVRNINGTYSPWTSPLGTPLAIKAAYAMVPWSDLASALVPNGRYLDFDSRTAGLSTSPVGDPLNSYIKGLYSSGLASGWYVGPGVDPEADLTTWKNELFAGEPFSTQAAADLARVSTYHGGYSVGGKPASLLLQNGWTDDLFTPAESLRVYNSQKAAGNNDVRLIFNDLGHDRSQNKADQGALQNAAGAAFFDNKLKGIAGGPAAGSATAMAMTCNPNGAFADPMYPSGPAVTASSWAALHPNAVRFTSNPSKTLELKQTAGGPIGGDEGTGFSTDPLGVYSSVDNPAIHACRQLPDKTESGVATYTFTSKGFNLLGLPTVKATVSTTGKYGEIVSRLWDVTGGQRRLVTRGVYRLKDNQTGTITFQLHGNYYNFAAGHKVKLELLPKDNPTYLTSKGAFKVKVSKLTLELPSNSAKSSSKGVVSPTIGKFVR